MGETQHITQEDLDAGAATAVCPACDLGFLLGQEFTVVPTLGIVPVSCHAMCVEAAVHGIVPGDDEPEEARLDEDAESVLRQKMAEYRHMLSVIERIMRDRGVDPDEA